MSVQVWNKNPNYDPSDPSSYPGEAIPISGRVNSSINNLEDISINNPENGQGLIYNNTTHKWENQDISDSNIWSGTYAEFQTEKTNIPDGAIVNIIDDYESNVCQTVAECMSSTNDNDVAGADVIKEINPNVIKNITNSNTDIWTSGNYSAGTYKIKEDHLYCAKQSTSSSWVANEWEEVNIATLKNALSNRYVKTSDFNITITGNGVQLNQLGNFTTQTYINAFAIDTRGIGVITKTYTYQGALFVRFYNVSGDTELTSGNITLRIVHYSFQ